MHRMLTCLCIGPSIQIRGFMKGRSLFTNRRQIVLCVSWKH